MPRMTETRIAREDLSGRVYPDGPLWAWVITQDGKDALDMGVREQRTDAEQDCVRELARWAAACRRCGDPCEPGITPGHGCPVEARR